MSEQLFFVRVWVEDGEVRFVNSNTHEITFDVVQIEGADVYDFEISGSYMMAEKVQDQLSVANNELSTGNLNVANFNKRS